MECVSYFPMLMHISVIIVAIDCVSSLHVTCVVFVQYLSWIQFTFLENWNVLFSVYQQCEIFIYRHSCFYLHEICIRQLHILYLSSSSRAPRRGSIAFFGLSSTTNCPTIILWSACWCLTLYPVIIPSVSISVLVSNLTQVSVSTRLPAVSVCFPVIYSHGFLSGYCVFKYISYTRYLRSYYGY